MPVEDVVAQDEADRVAADERFSQDEGLGQAVRRGLNDVGEANAEFGAVSQQAFEGVLLVGRGDDENVLNARQHKDAQGIVDHRFVVDGKKLLRDGLCDRV